MFKLRNKSSATSFTSSISWVLLGISNIGRRGKSPGGRVDVVVVEVVLGSGGRPTTPVRVAASTLPLLEDRLAGRFGVSNPGRDKFY